MSIFSDRKTLLNTFERVILLTFISILIASLFISVVNDIYAFAKSDESVTLSVSQPMKLSALAKTLQKEGVIKNPLIFSIFVKTKSRSEKLESFVGTVTLSKDMSYREIMLVFS